MRNGRTPEVKGETEKTTLVKIFDSVWERVVEVRVNRHMLPHLTYQ